ncbi:TnpV protein [[Clostridium] innocuum]|uniref:TnpV protein n=1 Tax=Clostridium innocuum TaxID=1522 RepID=UPI001F567EFB|nr:TnpV protein [[Clostridium] innocuum]MCI2989255.1 TnpV protein [[Clostridium] innocuum]
MEKSLFEQMGGTYTQVGDYLLPNLILPEQQDQSIGVWGQRHARYLKQHHKIIYMNLLTSGKLNNYLVDIDNQAENLFLQLVKQLAESEDITEELKAKDQMEWVAQMNNVCNRAREIVNSKLIFI